MKRPTRKNDIPLPIIADPLRFYALGIRNLMDMAALVHIGRCGLIGCTRMGIAKLLGVEYDTARNGVDRLAKRGLITCVSRHGTPGWTQDFTCTAAGWELLTQPADFSMFPHAQMALGKGGA